MQIAIIKLPGSGYWTYQKSNRSICLGKAFENNSVDERIAIFNKTILNIFHSFIPDEALLFDDKDFPSWFTKN